MASKQGKRPAAAAADNEPINAKVSMLVGDGTPTFYVNNAEVGNTAYDFSVTCSKIPSKLSDEAIARARSDGRIDVEALVQLVLPPGLIPGLIRALTVQKELYEKLFGPISDPSQDQRGNPKDGH